MNANYQALGFDSIIDKLKSYTVSDGAAAEFDALAPILDEAVCRRKMAETTAARRLYDVLGAPPLAAMRGLGDLLELSQTGAMLVPEQLTALAKFAGACRRMGAYLRRGEAVDAAVASYGRSLCDLSEVQSEIERCVGEDRVHDEASPRLRDVRRRLEHTEGQIKEKLSDVLRTRKQYLADSYISMRGGHYVLPVQRRFQSQFGGTAIEVSGKGSVVFMEPAAVEKLQAQRAELLVEEDGEERSVLYTLTALVSDEAPHFSANREAMEVLDVLFAKARLSAALDAGPVEVGCARRLVLRQGRHPLLDRAECVPLDLTLEEGTRGVVITGPNTGGKTVALKTAGLLCLMAQCALHVPCGAGSYLPLQDGYWCDIGDSQSISQNLSTFSGHITNVISILEQASRDSLVLLDELGSGTDPAEGMGIAVAVLEELRRRGCMFLVTTHYPQVKTYAREAQGVETARMAFDRETLRPLYRLELGKEGESCALHIARRLGMAPGLLDRAHRAVYGGAGEDSGAAMPPPKSRLVREKPKPEDLAAKFAMGDSVTVLPGGETGIVYRPADDLGDVVVQVQGVKRRVKHNRLRLQVAAAELYPPDYDFSIVFDTVENRKARHQMGRKYSPEISAEYPSIEKTDIKK